MYSAILATSASSNGFLEYKDNSGEGDRAAPAAPANVAAKAVAGDGSLDLSDAIFVLAFLFLGGPEPECLESADSNDDGALDITDGVHLLNFLFTGGPAPPAPGPPPGPCGAGTDPLGSSGTLTCASYDPC